MPAYLRDDERDIQYHYNTSCPRSRVMQNPHMPFVQSRGRRRHGSTSIFSSSRVLTFVCVCVFVLFL